MVFIVLHPVVSIKSDRNSCVKNDKREIKREVQTLLILLALQRCPIIKVGVHVRFSVSESCRNCQTQPNKSVGAKAVP